MKRFVVIASLLALAGCQSAGGGAEPYSASVPAAQPPATASSNQSVVAQDQASQSNTYSKADGTVVTKTTSSSAQATVDPGTATAFLAGVAAAAALGKQEERSSKPVVQVKDMVGGWTVYLNSEERVCELTLSTEPKDDGYSASFNHCMDGDLFFVSNWRMKGQELVLFDNFSRAKGSMRMTEWNRWEGQLASNSKPITIAR
ncbi:AprI/Inh family metalloprotease inhibitor [Pseudovibrio sp. Ad26]|uniref:AprI/Inh family metalloprotease inhibitor n=1 Tax=Pseudovibrio sp. Ad26 TaxID=989410 RepID=UPI0007AED162|nr:AprI/Inh family metalloprotease inhibitor [Pseudovibrio sp. Ad26]KZL05659.1 Protease inhibitor Inh [Pseudovibrio sp. Ad26]